MDINEYIDLETYRIKVRMTVTQRTKYTCNICSHQFTFNNYLNEQKAQMCCKTKYSCNICHSSFAIKNHLSKHIKVVHDGTKIDDGSMNDRKSKGYEEKKPFHCDECPSTFAESGALKKHKMIHWHSSERPFKCEHCPSTFCQKVNLISHISTQ